MTFFNKLMPAKEPLSQPSTFDVVSQCARREALPSLYVRDVYMRDEVRWSQ